RGIEGDAGAVAAGGAGGDHENDREVMREGARRVGPGELPVDQLARVEDVEVAEAVHHVEHGVRAHGVIGVAGDVISEGPGGRVGGADVYEGGGSGEGRVGEIAAGEGETDADDRRVRVRSRVVDHDQAVLRDRDRRAGHGEVDIDALVEEHVGGRVDLDAEAI